MRAIAHVAELRVDLRLLREPPIVDEQNLVPVDGGPAIRFLHDQRPVEAARQLLPGPVVRVIPVGSGVGRREVVEELAALRHGRLGKLRHTVHGVIDSDAMPMHGGGLRQRVHEPARDALSLPDANDGARHVPLVAPNRGFRIVGRHEAGGARPCRKRWRGREPRQCGYRQRAGGADACERGCEGPSRHEHRECHPPSAVPTGRAMVSASTLGEDPILSSPETSAAVCGVSGSPADGTPAVDQTSTETCRSAMAAGGAVPPPNACRFGQGEPPGRPPSAQHCFPEPAGRVSALPSLLNAPGTFGPFVPVVVMRFRASRHGHGLRGAARPAGRDRRAADRTPGRRADHDRDEKRGLKGSRAFPSLQHAIRVSTQGASSQAGRLGLHARCGEEEGRKHEADAHHPRGAHGDSPDHRDASSRRARTCFNALADSSRPSGADASTSNMGLFPRSRCSFCTATTRCNFAMPDVPRHYESRHSQTS